MLSALRGDAGLALLEAGVQSRDRRLGHAVGSRQVGLRTAFRDPLDGLCALRGTTKPHSTSLSAAPAIAVTTAGLLPSSICYPLLFQSALRMTKS